MHAVCQLRSIYCRIDSSVDASMAWGRPVLFKMRSLGESQICETEDVESFHFFATLRKLILSKSERMRAF